MPSVKLAPIGNQQFVDENGSPAVGWKYKTYVAGSSTPLATYTDSSGNTAHPAAIILDALGLPTTGPIWLAVGSSYKIVVTDEDDVVKETYDNIAGINDASISTSQWQASGVTPTYISATSFSVPGDQTTEFHVGRRAQFTTTAGTVYGVIRTTAYTTLTTVTVEMDNGQALDSGLSVANVSILRADNLALPSNKAGGASRVIGLTGNVNAATPLTKFDLAANGAVLRDATGWTYAYEASIAAKTCDLGLAGPAANGRDQSAAFTADSFVHLYLIYDPSTNTVATLASATAPTSFTGSTLPTGYTHWCYATTIRWNASSNIVKCYARGCALFYEAKQSALAAGNAITETTISLPSLVPSNALRVMIWGYLANNGAAAGTYGINVRLISGASPFISLAIGVETAAGASRDSITAEVPNVGQTLYYIGDSASTSFTLDVTGYKVPNGDA